MESYIEYKYGRASYYNGFASGFLAGIAFSLTFCIIAYQILK
jgi:hypothetical protein